MTVKVIAECGVNWNTLTDAIHMIIEAKATGAGYVKFQLFNEETIRESPLKEKLKPLILDEDGVKLLKSSADTEDIGLVLTPMYLEAVDIAAKYADMLKIRFKDNENQSFIDKALDTGKPVLISVPGPMLASIDRKWAFSARMIQLYCIPKYPPEPEDFNLDQACACKGFSSHFPHALFDLAFAINRIYDDAFIEKHVMFETREIGIIATMSDGTRERVRAGEVANHPIDEAVSLTFDELKNFIKQLQLIERIKRTRL